MNEEEKKAISMCKLLLNGDITLHVIDDDGGTAYAGIVNREYNKDLQKVLNLIEKQQKEIEQLKKYDYRKIKLDEKDRISSIHFTKEQLDLMNLGIALYVGIPKILKDGEDEETDI